MKLLHCLPKSSWIVCLALVLSSLPGVLVHASDSGTEYKYKPEEFGINLGISEQELFTSLVNQGFSFKPDGKYKKIQGSKVLGLLFDYILSVGEDNGSVDIWSSANVVLGIKDGALSVVEESYEFPAKEAEQVFAELTDLFDKQLTRATGGRSNRSIWTVKERRFDKQWHTLHWLTLKSGSVSKISRIPQDRHTQQLIWREGNRYFSMSLRHATTKTGRKIRKKKVLLLMHVDWCAYPILDEMYYDNDFNCAES